MTHLLAQERIVNPVINGLIGNVNNSAGGIGILQLFLTTLLNFAFALGGVIFFIMLIWGGYEYLTAGGDKEAVQKATKRLTNGFIGICILFSIYALLFVIEVLFGISLRSPNIPTIG